MNHHHIMRVFSLSGFGTSPLQRFVRLLLLCWLCTLPLIWWSVSDQVKPIAAQSLHSGNKSEAQTIDIHAYRSIQIHNGTGEISGTGEVSGASTNSTTYTIQPQWLLQNISRAPTQQQQHILLEGEAILHAARQNKHATLINAQSQPTAIAFTHSGLQDKNATFWLHVFLAWAALAVACLVWTYQPNTAQSYTVFACCICYALFLLCSVSQMQRLWAVPPSKLLWRYHLSHLFAYLCMWFILLMAWWQPYAIGEKIHTNTNTNTNNAHEQATPNFNHPKSGTYTNWCYWYPCTILVIFLLARANEFTGWTSAFGLVDIVCTSLVGVHILFAIAYQLYKTATAQPINTINCVAVSWVAGGLVLIVLTTISLHVLVASGIHNPKQELNITASMSLLILIIGFASIAIRTHLHRLQSIWMRSIHFFASAYGFFIGLWLWPAIHNTTYTWSAIAIGVLGAALAYLCVMFFQYKKLYRKHQDMLRKIGPTLLDRSTQQMHLHEQQALMESLVQEYMQPLQLQRLPLTHPTKKNPHHATIGDYGSTAHVLGITHNLRLIGHRKGKDLFDTLELSRLRSISQMARQGMTLVHIQRKGQESERKRIANDLQDSIGGKIVALQNASGAYGEYARHTLENLFLLTRSMDKGWHPLSETMANLQHAMQSNCEVHGITLHAQFNNNCNAHTLLDSAVVGHINSICNELVRNALQHPQVQSISLILTVHHTHLQLAIENDGDITDPALWKEGLGIVSMRRRFAELHGSIQWHKLEHGGVACSASFPIAQWLKPSNAPHNNPQPTTTI